MLIDDPFLHSRPTRLYRST